MMPGLVVKHTNNNNVAILECLTSKPEQGIMTNKLETMDMEKQECVENKIECSVEDKTECVEDKTTQQNQDISNIVIETEENGDDNTTETNKNRVPENNCTELNKLSIENCCEKNKNNPEEIPDTMDVQKYPDKEPPEKIEEQCEETTSICVNNIGEPSTSFTINPKKQTKLKTFLNKYNLTENELILKLKCMKRLTKDKVRLDSVLSHKLNRNYLKILKRRRSIKNKINNKSSTVTGKKEDTSEEYSTCESDDSEQEQEQEQEQEREEIQENAHVTENNDITQSSSSVSIKDKEDETKIEKQIEIEETQTSDNPINRLENEEIDVNSETETCNNTISSLETTLETSKQQNEETQNLLDNTETEVSAEIKDLKEELSDTNEFEINIETKISNEEKEELEAKENISEVKTCSEAVVDKQNSEIIKISDDFVSTISTNNSVTKLHSNEKEEYETEEADAELDYSKNSDALIIDLDEEEHNLSENEESQKNTDVIEVLSEDEEQNNLVIDESKTTSDDFMHLLESLEKVEQKETKIQEKSVNILEDKNKNSVLLVCEEEFEDSLEMNEVLSTIQEEPCLEIVDKKTTEDGEVQNISENIESSKEDCENKSPLTLMPNLFEDDDIRNKIKQQLELLRRNTRKSVSVEPIENEPEIIETNVTEKIPENNKEETITSKRNTSVNLSDVLISNEGELAIINVVGGYISENEDEDDKPEEAELQPEKEEEDDSIIEDSSKNLKRGISITDKLLMNFSKDNCHIIKPTKTTDITKIKGWRSKTFNVINEEDVIKSPIEPNEVLQIAEIVIPPLVYFKPKETQNSLENPIPGTSFDVIVPETTEISKTTEPPGIQEEPKIPEQEDKKSAFVSDYLETFLSTNSELKISYEVPKLVAEGTISKPEEMPLSEFPAQPVSELNTTTSYKSKSSASKKAKPKTLAEKRRMMELDRRNELLHDMETNEQIYLKRLEYCEKRHKSNIANGIRDNLVANVAPFSRLCWNLATKETHQFAVCKGKKIRLSGSSGGKDIIVPETKLNKFNSTANSDNASTATGGYRPGPLSMKHKLITKDNWECQVLRMPKIKLEVYPEQNKPLPLIAQQYLQLCRHDQCIVNKNWAFFAVTAVQTKEKPTHINKFEFEIPYANGRNKILVRRPVRKLSPVKYPERTYSNRFPEINVEECIKDVVSDLLTCVENRELGDKIIKDDPDLHGLFGNQEKDVERPPSPIDPMVQAIIKRPNAKRNKTTLELRRLNVQVIEVDVKEDDYIPDNCMKEYCKLGCVCKSLRGASALIPEHCGREECMLECNCSFGALQKGRHQITLPPGTDLLSASTVVRLQDEAKRNLAKVEREFTQTVIKANNQTIMVGGGARERTRRIPKVPKKYSNFAVDKPNPKGVSNYDKIMSDGAGEEELIENDTEKAPLKKKPEIEEPMFLEAKKPVPIWINKDKEKPEKKFTKTDMPCFVVLDKIKLDHIIPWCMVHNLYKCHCGGKATFPKIIETIKPVQAPIEDTEYISYNPRFGGARHSDTTPHTITEVTDKYCARTKALPSNYYHARNKSQRFKADYAVMKQIEEKNTHFDQTNANRNKRKSLDSHETYSYDDMSFDNMEYLVPVKKKSTVTKKHRLLFNKKKSEEAELLKTFEEDDDDDDSLESLSLLERLNGSNNQTQQKMNSDKGRKTKKLKPKIIMRDPDKSQSPILDKNTKILIPESLQLTSEDFVATSDDSKLTFEGEQQKKRLENTHIVSSTAFIDYDRSFQGLLIPSKEWLDRFHKMLNPNDHTIIHQIRLLEWATMVKRQECNSLQVWFNTKKYNSIILTEDRRRPSKSHINVRTFKSCSLNNFKVPDIIASLLSGKLPGAANKATETYLILLFNGMCWEARGTIVLSGTTEICKKKLFRKPTPTCILTQSLHGRVQYMMPKKFENSTNNQLTLESVNGTLIIKSSPAMSVEVRTPTAPISPIPTADPPPAPATTTTTTTNELEIISLPSPKRTSPVLCDKKDKPEIDGNIPVIDRTKYNIGNILAPLPTGGDLHRWFMLILENDFSVLRISFSKFHIKYTHLQTAINMARKSQKTVRIKTPPVNSPDISENFSIYACPESSQRIFFGPYGNRSDHGLETFRYVNGKLVNTKIYNKMRGNPERKTSGYWFTHNSTLNHNLNLEPNYDEGSSGSECATAVTSIENVTKPQIELVDLTANDSDSEHEIIQPKIVENEVDPLLSLLSVDLSKKVTNDITIEAVPLNSPVVVEKPKKSTKIEMEMEIEAINVPLIKEKPKLLDRKRKSVQDDSEEPAAKQPTLIDSIELDDDDEEMPVLEPYNKEQNHRKVSPMQMPPLRPINTMPPKDKNKSKNKCLYVITNIPGIGYFEIFFEKTKTNRQSMYMQIKGSKTTFQTINNAIKYLHYLCTKYIYFMPKTLKVKFSIVDSADPPDMSKFKDDFLNGYHMISERGIFNILNINTKELDHLGFDEEEIQKLLSYKCDLLIARNIKQLGTFLFGHEASKKMPQEEILRLAPGKIKLMEQQETNLLEEKNVMNSRQQKLLVLLKDLEREIPESIRNINQQKITNILNKRTTPVQEQPNWNEMQSDSSSQLNPEKLDSSAVVKPIPNISAAAPAETSKQLANSAMLTKTLRPLPIVPFGKICRIVDGKILVIDPKAAANARPPSPRLQIPSVNILSPQQFQNLINPKPNDKNSKFELLVPITGLQSPATVVAYGQNKSQPKIVDLTDD